ncbi:inositol 1, 3, 4-trisphosphate 56-kinase [Anaeromyces robustus]|uniref:Inositol-tetrakisphosphate 1-kinase n=1 Tax=Anaeromyces robustus TaxID=1754192 RepID=A0A1Y1XCQ6_9FUNG|nr:inositol 1, 3, 4-trisphosphate 56-kinase [Anaeromyces robustus]|eukprot:ORX83571.1 inositol 1, 3, 4-trisphosphate 56-kinase [Anaeromyces robustus]
MSEKKYKIGYVFSEKKIKHQGIQQFIDYSRSNNFIINPINLDIPIENQGPYDLIIHKITDLIAKAENGDEAVQKQVDNFKNYVKNNPNIPILDPLDVVCKLMDRITSNDLLEKVRTMEKENGKIYFKLPDYTIKPLYKDKLKDIHFPIMCKRINACSTKIAHEMALVPTLDKVDEARKIMSSSTNKEDEEYIIQQFINHDGILFKIYVYDNNYKVIIRPSLNNVTTEDIVFFDSQKIPKEFKEQENLDSDAPPLNSFGNLSPAEVVEKKSLLLDYDKITEITNDLSDCLNLTLYGYDVIIDSETNDYYIVDVNYFPAFAGVKDFNEVLYNAILKKLNN